MCGIAGTYDLVQGLPSPEGLVVRMTDALAHRGPDDAGVMLDSPVALGNRRLAIFDLSPTGHQPMASPDERLWIAYNGEVYNHVELGAELRGLGHRFRGTSDTEVVLAAYAQWGPAMLPRLNGDFALAIWDRVARTLFLARDRFGVKGLYWTIAGGRLRFASEIKSLLLDPAVARAPNGPRLLDFLAHELIDHTAETLFQGVHQLRPGHALTVAASGVGRPQQWYRLEPARLDGRDAVAAVRELLSDAVRLRLRSDVPVGVALSGGVDSSSVLALGAKLRAAAGARPPDSFTARCRNPQIDEGPWVAHAVEATGSRNHALLPEEDDLLTDLDTLLWHMDEPFHSPTVYGHWKVLELARARQAIVLLEGQGGDEVFAGYHYLYPALLWGIARSPRNGGPARAWAEVQTRARVHGVPVQRTLVDVAKLLAPPALRGRHAPAWLAPGFTPPPRPLPGRSLAEQQLHCLTVSPLPAFLHHDDRNSMSVSLEARPPFLDHRLAEVGLALRADQLLRDGFTKWAVRRAMRGVVPDALLDRPDKQGFSVDQQEWLSGALGRSVEQALSPASLAARPWLSAPALQGLLAAHRAGAGDHARELWRAFVAERWLRLFVDPARLVVPAGVTSRALRHGLRSAGDRVARPGSAGAAAHLAPAAPVAG